MSVARGARGSPPPFRKPATVCGLCQRDLEDVDSLSAVVLEPEDLVVLLANNPWWRPEVGICPDCASRFVEASAEARRRYPAFARGACAILPTPVRLAALDTYTGKGVTVAFLDSGFYAHPDLVEGRDRILRYVDVTDPEARRRVLETPDDSSWHGMMTSVVACGDGRLSGGLYRGLASEANVVLVKVGTARRIVHDDIRKGLDWIIRNKGRYDIRVVNVSCGGDFEASYLTDALSQAADRATRAGILVVAASGNRPDSPVLPPASAPSVLTVGALDDKNRLGSTAWDIYHSSYGPTFDGVQKPEVIAPGIWVAAPILPGTPTAAQAALLSRLAEAADEDLRPILRRSRGVDHALDDAAGLEPHLVRQLVKAKLRDNNVISGAYKHVDGTSFAAPIVTSIAAQMLEANPRLKPQDLKRILMKTARRMPHVPVDRQGWGVVDARAAVLESLARKDAARAR